MEAKKRVKRDGIDLSNASILFIDNASAVPRDIIQVCLYVGSRWDGRAFFLNVDYTWRIEGDNILIPTKK